jgi:NDP-sugar pyrophosphorylase family protein
VIDLVKDDYTIWEREPLEIFAQQSQMMAYQHHGFWQPMDTLREKLDLEKLAIAGDPPWLSGKLRKVESIITTRGEYKKIISTRCSE